jgi:hypothetical protein
MRPRQNRNSRSRRKKDSTFKEYISELTSTYISVRAMKRSVDSMGMDREMLIEIVKLGISEFDRLCSAITDGRERHAFAAAAHLKNLLDLTLYATISRMEAHN